MRTLAMLLSTVLVFTGAMATPASAAPGTVATIEFTPIVINGGESATGVATLAEVSTSDTTVTLVNFAPSLLAAPSTVTVPAGSLSASFSVTGRPITTGWNWACLQVAQQGAVGCLVVNPVGGPVLSEVALVPILVAGGDPVSGAVRYLSPTAGVTVQLTSSHPAVVGVPAQVVVPTLDRGAPFAVTTSVVNAPTVVTITASALGRTQTGTLTVTPRADSPFADTVRIKKAEWDGRLRIEATSTRHDAILTVFFSSSPDLAAFRLHNDGNGRYSIERPWLDNPLPIIVRSNYGGVATSGS